MKRAASVIALLVVLRLGIVAQNSTDFSGTYLLISVKADNPPKKVPSITQTKWELSKDSTKLTIHSKVEFP